MAARVTWDQLSSDEKEYAMLCLAEINETGSSPTLDALSDVDWECRLPSIEEFLMDPYFAGGKSAEMYPLLQNELIDIFNGDYDEIILTGSIGWGKSWVSSFGLVYDLLTLLCLRNPQQFYGLASTSNIVLMNLSVTGSNAHEVLWSYVYNLFVDMPWTKERYPNRDWKKLGLWFGDKRVVFKSGSSSEFSAIGQNIIGGALDEANFFIGTRRSRRAIKAGEADQAKVLYDQLARRRKSRFLQKSGRTPGHFWLISSKQFPGDFLEKKIEESKGNPSVKIIDYPQWVPKKSLPDGGPYSGKDFVLFIGTAEHRSRILADDSSTFDSRSVEVPPNCKIVNVPVEYIIEFRQDLYGSIRDVCGHSINAVNPFFDRLDCYDDCIIVEGHDLPRVHPYEFEETHIIDVSLVKWNLFPASIDKRTGLIQSALNPGSPRFAHIDLSQSGDATGVCVGHYGGHVKVESMVEVPDLETGSTKFILVLEERPITMFDFMMRFTPPIGGRIDIEKIRLLLKAIGEYFNWIWKEVSYDQYQSATSIKAWNDDGVKSFVHSVDRTSKSYEFFRSAMYQKRCSFYKYAPLRRDLGSLDWDSKSQKVDHRPGGTKDVSDCCAGVVEHVERNYPRIPIVFNPTWGIMTSGKTKDQSEKDNFAREITPGYKRLEEVIADRDYDPWEKASKDKEWDPLGDMDE